jgi:hypothetical protein|tara:strand:+ start:541 stop:969 length:429 start_codon:yes stop_codon:yes gene_type:complete
MRVAHNNEGKEEEEEEEAIILHLRRRFHLCNIIIIIIITVVDHTDTKTIPTVGTQKITTVPAVRAKTTSYSVAAEAGDGAEAEDEEGFSSAEEDEAEVEGEEGANLMVISAAVVVDIHRTIQTLRLTVVVSTSSMCASFSET